jgi:hypothetical protein
MVTHNGSLALIVVKAMPVINFTAAYRLGSALDPHYRVASPEIGRYDYRDVPRYGTGE